MSKCPFWSSNIRKVECDKKCPMNNFFSIKDNCPFKEYLGDSNIKIKGIEEEDYNYQKHLISSYISKVK